MESERGRVHHEGTIRTTFAHAPRSRREFVDMYKKVAGEVTDLADGADWETVRRCRTEDAGGAVAGGRRWRAVCGAMCNGRVAQPISHE